MVIISTIITGCALFVLELIIAFFAERQHKMEEFADVR